jgi:hypothetical protein
MGGEVMEYAVRFVQTDRANEMEAILAGFAEEGWRVVAVTPIPDYWRFWVTLERDVEEAK